MAIDPSSFIPHNVTDSCSVWNVLSSNLLYRRANGAGVRFYCTVFVIYECLHKPRKSIREKDSELKRRMISAQTNSDFIQLELSIDDLQTVEILEARKSLGKGELSSIAFAKKTGQAVMTDDKQARKLASAVVGNKFSQTTPHLVGWLVYGSVLSDADIETVKSEHTTMERSLAIHFEAMRQEGLRCRLMSPRATKSGNFSVLRKGSLPRQADLSHQ